MRQTHARWQSVAKTMSWRAAPVSVRMDSTLRRNVVSKAALRLFMPATSPAGTLHSHEWTGNVASGELYKEALYDYGIIAEPFPTRRHTWLTCKGLHHGSRGSHISWHTSINKFTGTNTRYVLMPTTGDAYGSLPRGAEPV